MFRDNARARNDELEKTVVKIQEQLNKNDYEWENDHDLRSVLEKNKELSDEIDTLKIRLPELKEKIRNAKVCGKGMNDLFFLIVRLIKFTYFTDCKMKHDNLNINLDLLNEVTHSNCILFFIVTFIFHLIPMDSRWS